VDHFGNAITNFPSTLIPPGGAGRVEGEGFTIERVFDTFGEACDPEPFIYRGSSGNLEIGINRGRAAERLELKSGFTLRLLLGF
jgi:S-adenosylmethionine hydrolase